MSECGTLYGIGVGPGDPELITVKAKRVLERVRYVFAPVAGKQKKSIAYTIAQSYISSESKVETLLFPMTTDQKECEKAWEVNVVKIATILEKGRDAAFITIGDPLTYSTYGYLLKKMQGSHPHLRMVTIPGITSYGAVAAAASLPLGEGKEILALIPGATSPEKLKQLLSAVDTAVLLKHNKKTKDLYGVLREMKLCDKLVYVSRCGFEDQQVTVNPTEDLLDRTEYLSLLIVKKSLL